MKHSSAHHQNVRCKPCNKTTVF